MFQGEAVLRRWSGHRWQLVPAAMPVSDYAGSASAGGWQGDAPAPANGFVEGGPGSYTGMGEERSLF